MTPAPTPAELRALRRRFIKTHHPDAGGHGGTFIAGLAELDRLAGPAPAPPAPTTARVVVIRRRSLPKRLGALLGSTLSGALAGGRPRPAPRVR